MSDKVMRPVQKKRAGGIRHTGTEPLLEGPTTTQLNPYAFKNTKGKKK